MNERIRLMIAMVITILAGVWTPGVQVQAQEDFCYHAAMAPDGRVAWACGELLVADEGAVQVIEETELRVEYVTWSHDGTWLAYLGESRTDGRLKVKITDLNGTVIHPGEGVQGAYTPIWSPTENRLAYGVKTDSGLDIQYVLLEDSGIDSTTTLGLKDYAETQPMFSPDGGLLFWVRQKGEDVEIVAVTWEGRSHTLSVDDGVVLEKFEDGWLYYQQMGYDGLCAVTLDVLGFGQPTCGLPVKPVCDVVGVDFARDGFRMAYNHQGLTWEVFSPYGGLSGIGQFEVYLAQARHYDLVDYFSPGMSVLTAVVRGDEVLVTEGFVNRDEVNLVLAGSPCVMFK